MLTARFLQRFLFKWKYAILIISMISALAGGVSIQIDRWLPNYALSFSHLVSQQFHTQITFNSVNYRFPNYIIFKDVDVREFDGKTHLLQASKVTMDFSFPLFSSATPLNYIIIKDMEVNYPVLKDYLTRHHKKICAWARALPKGNFRLIIPDGKFYQKDYRQSPPRAFKIDLNIEQGRVSALGFWDAPDRFNYELEGTIRNAGFDLDKLTLKNGRSSMNLWGSWRDNAVDWNGFIFYDKFYILDIDGHLKIDDRDIVLKRLSFSIDGNGVGAQGHCSRQGLFQCDADVTYLQGGQHLDQQGPFKKVNLHLHAQNTLHGLSINGAADLSMRLNPAPRTSIQNLHFDFKGLKARAINGNLIKLRIKQVQAILSIQNDKYDIPLESVLATINFSVPYQKTMTLSARMLDGHCHSRIFLDTSSVPWHIKSQVDLDGVAVDQGLLSGTFNIESSKDTKISGNIALHNGDFNDTKFQAWMAKTLQMPSLEHLSGADISCQFRVDGRSKMLDDLKLSTDDLDLNGNFYLDGDDLVTSRGSLRFSKKLLSESDIGRHIIGLVRGAWTMPFEFSLSGNMYRMNFQWDKSPLKDKVRQHLFSFFESIIDRRMDAHPYYNVTMPNESVSPG